jgi:hypothetical protein
MIKDDFAYEALRHLELTCLLLGFHFTILKDHQAGLTKRGGLMLNQKSESERQHSAHFLKKHISTKLWEGEGRRSEGFIFMGAQRLASSDY